MIDQTVQIDRPIHREHIASALRIAGQLQAQARDLDMQAMAALSEAVAVVLEDVGEKPDLAREVFKLKTDDAGRVVAIIRTEAPKPAERRLLEA